MNDFGIYVTDGQSTQEHNCHLCLYVYRTKVEQN